MIKAKFYSLLGICFGLLLYMSVTVQAQQAPDDVYWAAEDGLSRFIKQIPRTSMKQYGFQNSERIESSKLGEPYKIYAIPPNALSLHKPGGSIDNLIQETSMWYFPVMLNEREKAILVVDIVNKEWKAVLFGHAKLAKELLKMRNQWPRKKGYNPKLIAVFQAKEMLFHIPEKDSLNLTALRPKNRAFAMQADDKDYSELETLSNVVPRLKQLANKNLENGF